MATTTNVDSLKINVLTKAQYNSATKDSNQLYLVTDDTIDNATTTTAGLMSASDKSKLDGIASNANKTTVDSSLSSTSTNPVQNKVINSALAGKSDTNHTHSGYASSSHTHSNYASTVTTNGNGNAITAISQSGNTITATKSSTFLTAHPSITKSTDSTSTASPAHGGTFTAIDSITRDTNGHVTKVNTKTITLPSAGTSTDTKVTQTVTSSNASYPLLLAPSGQTSTTTTTSYFDSGVTLNPNNNTIAANISGNAATATKATQDGNGKTIASTYLPLSGGTLTGNLNFNSTAKIIMNSITMNDFISDSGTVQDTLSTWGYLKTKVGLAFAWIKVPLKYSSNKAILETSGYLNYPINFKSGELTFGTLNTSDNTVGTAGWTVAVVPVGNNSQQCRVFIRNPNNNFSSSTPQQWVSVLIIGEWQ